MPVYSYRSIEEIRSSIRTLATNVTAKMPLKLSQEEFALAFIRPEHLPKLEEVATLCGIKMHTNPTTVLFTSQGYRAKCVIDYVAGTPILVPGYVSGGLASTCPDELRAKITGWLDERVRFGLAFGAIYDVLDYLNENCGDLKAMSVMAPCLPSIIRNISSDADSKAAKRARALTATNKFGKLPRLPQTVKQRLLDASALINAATLMLEAPEPERKMTDGFVRASILDQVPGKEHVLHDANGAVGATFM